MTEIPQKPENVILFDMDGTLCDYDKALSEAMEKMRSPYEPTININSLRENVPDYLMNRSNLIRSSETWWENLPRFELGWHVLKVAMELEYKPTIVTQGPRRNAAAWAGKKRWIDKNLGEDFDIIITRNKGPVYGKVLVDDYPEYITKWLKWRPRGLVIMPAHESNLYFAHSQVIRYDGSNLEQVKSEMERVKQK